LRLWHLTSLDAPTVAIVWTLAFAWAWHLVIPVWLVLVIGLSAWTFYIADRLLDAQRARTPLRLRHRFHWRYRRIFVPLAAAAGAAALVLVLRNMPARIEARNSLLAVAALAYFTGVHSGRQRKLLPKELLVAIVFTVTCATPSLWRAPHPLEILPVLLIFSALAWLNCTAIERWESETVAANNVLVEVRRYAVALAVLGMLAALGAAALGQPRTALLLLAAALSAGLLGQMDLLRKRLSVTALRVGADLVLLTPLVLLAWRR
jgi:hypothetical protein